MLSICIPVYGHDVRPLVHELLRQAGSVGEPLEVLVYDDGSEAACRMLNRGLRDLPRVRYTELEEHGGAAALRNRMVRAAAGNRLLFLDADSRPNPRLIARYLEAPPADVLVGGLTYADERPGDPEHYLHWCYGRHREALAPARRRQARYLYFQSNNFMADREVLLTHPFPRMPGAGHEDTLWGQLLAPDGIQIEYIDNPVTHLGLEPTEVFLQKQRQAVENLKMLRRSYPTLTTRLTRFADRYPKMVQFAVYVPERVLMRYLLRSYNLKVLDLLKLKWWMSDWAPAINYR